MGYFDRLFASSEARAAVGVLDEVGAACPRGPWAAVRSHVESMIHAQADALRKMIREGGSVRRIVVIAVARDAANLLESGQYCIHRGVLSGEGTALLAFYDDLIDELLRTGAIDETLAANQKTVLRHNIQGVG